MADNNGNGIMQALAARLVALEAKVAEGNTGGWMSDVQRILALLLVGTFTFLTAVFAVRLLFSTDTATTAALLKELKDALVQMVMMALGFFLGNTMSKMVQDKASQNVVEKLTSPPPAGPVAPVPSPTTSPIEAAWWNRLTDAERKAITDAAAADTGDAKLAGIATGPITMKPVPDDLAYLVTKGLLTQERSTAIQGA